MRFLRQSRSAVDDGWLFGPSPPPRCVCRAYSREIAILRTHTSCPRPRTRPNHSLVFFLLAHLLFGQLLLPAGLSSLLLNCHSHSALVASHLTPKYLPQPFFP